MSLSYFEKPSHHWHLLCESTRPKDSILFLAAAQEAHSNDNKSVPQSMSADTSEFGGKYDNCLLERPHNAGVRLVYKVFDDAYLDSGVMPIVGV